MATSSNSSSSSEDSNVLRSEQKQMASRSCLLIGLVIAALMITAGIVIAYVLVFAFSVETDIDGRMAFHAPWDEGKAPRFVIYPYVHQPTKQPVLIEAYGPPDTDFLENESTNTESEASTDGPVAETEAPDTDSQEVSKLVSLSESDERRRTKKNSGPMFRSPIDATRLPANIRPVNYNLEIKTYLPGYGAQIPTEKEFVFEGEVEISAKTVEAAMKVELNAKWLTLESYSMKINGIDAKCEFEDQPSVEKWAFYTKRKINVGETVTLKLKYTGLAKPDNFGLYIAKYNNSMNVTKYAMTTQMEPLFARRMVPCFDEPSFKATWEVTIIHPKGTTALANNIETSVVDVGNEWRRSKFRRTPVVMSTYLLAIVVSDYTYSEAYTNRGLRVRVWSRPGTESRRNLALRVGVQMTEYMETLFEENYHMPKLDMIAFDDYHFGAMENWGLITYVTYALLEPNEVNAHTLMYLVSTIAHELAHSWFGNQVTLQFWDEIFVNEAFASIFQTLSDRFFPDKFYDHPGNAEFMKNAYLLSASESAIISDSDKSQSHPMSNDIRNQDEIQSSFDFVPYRKGAHVWRMIWTTMDRIGGEGTFLKSIRKMLRKYKFKNIHGRDLIEEVIAGPLPELKGFFDAYFFQDGVPLLNVRYFNETHGQITQERLWRTNGSVNSRYEEVEKNGNAWNVPIYIQYGDSQDYDLQFMRAGEPFYFKWDKYGLTLVNPDRLAYARVNYDDEYLGQIMPYLKGKSMSTDTKATFITDLYQSMALGRANPNYFKDTINYLSQETEWAPWAMFFEAVKGIGKIKYFGELFDDAWRPHLPEARQILASSDTETQKRFLQKQLFAEKIRQVCKSSLGDNHYHCTGTNMARIRRSNDCAGIIGEKLMVQDISKLDKHHLDLLIKKIVCKSEAVLKEKYLPKLFNENISLDQVISFLMELAKTKEGRELVFRFFKDQWKSLPSKFFKQPITLSQLNAIPGPASESRQALWTEGIWRAQATVRRSY